MKKNNNFCLRYFTIYISLKISFSFRIENSYFSSFLDQIDEKNSEKSIFLIKFE
jgi:hypothetical protein